MSNDIFETLLSVINSTKIVDDVYVYFDADTGKIVQIGKTENSGLSYIKVHPDEVRPIMNGTRPMDDYEVIFDKKTKEYKISEYLITDNDYVYNTLYEVPVNINSHEINYDKVEVVITQNFKDNCWKIKLNKDLISNLSNNRTNIKNKISVSVTAKHDPNILYKVFDFKIDKIIKAEQARKTNLETIVNQELTTDNLETVYKGVNVDVWYDELPHLARQHVYTNGNVYRIINDQEADTKFNFDNVELIVDKVKLFKDINEHLEFDEIFYNGDIVLSYGSLFQVNGYEREFKKKYCPVPKDNLVLQYDKIYVDIWYDELSHYKGQHIWHNGTVYKIKMDIEKDNPFDSNFGEIICEAKLVEDENHTLDIVNIDNLENGNIVLKNNKLYLIKDLHTTSNYTGMTIKFEDKFEFEKDEVSIFTPRYFEYYLHEIIDYD